MRIPKAPVLVWENSQGPSIGLGEFPRPQFRVGRIPEAPVEVWESSRGSSRGLAAAQASGLGFAATQAAGLA